MEVRLKRVYDPESPGDGFRVLVDKLWPRGIRKEAFHYDLWAKRIAPSTSLRVWYHGDPAGRWAEFRRKYLDELGSSAAMQDFLDRIRTYPDVTLLYASRGNPVKIRNSTRCCESTKNGHRTFATGVILGRHDDRDESEDLP